MTLNKRAARSVKNNLAFYLITIFLTMLASTFIIASVSTGRTLTNILNQFMDSHAAEDAEFTTYVPIPQDDIDSLQEQYDILLEQSRYKDVKEGKVTYRIFCIPQKVNLFDVRDGALPDEGEALLTQRYADQHEIAVGDTVQAGDASYRVSAFTTKTDYLYMLETLTGSYRDNENFALLLVNEADYEKVDADEVSYYSIVYQKDNDLDVRKKIHADYQISSYVAATSNTRLSMPINQGQEVTNMALILGPVLFLIVIALIVMVLGRHIKNEQALIGTFLALGYQKGQIIRHYLRFALIPGVIGSVLGFLLAIPAVRLFSIVYIEYDFEVLSYHTTWDIPACLTALLLPSLLYCLITAIEAGRLLSRPPVELLRGTSKDGRTVGILKHTAAKTRTKLRVRSIIGHPGRSLVTVIGVAIAGVCVLVGFMMYDSMNDLLDNGLVDSTGYKYLYTLKTLGEGTPDEGEGLLRSGFEVDGAIVQLSLLGVDPDNSYFPDKTADGSTIQYDKYYITSAGASTYGVEKGDSFTFRNTIDLTKHTVKIAGVVTDNTKCALYTSRANAAELIGVASTNYNCIVSDQKLDLDADTIASTTVITDSAESIRSLMGMMYAIIAIIVALGALLGIFILYLIINMIATENRSNLSVMKILGFSGREIADRILNVNHVLVVLGFLLCIPCAYEILVIGYADTIENFGMLLDPVITAHSLIFSFFIVWIAYETSLLLQRRKLSKIDMVEALKENNRNE